MDLVWVLYWSRQNEYVWKDHSSYSEAKYKAVLVGLRIIKQVGVARVHVVDAWLRSELGRKTTTIVVGPRWRALLDKYGGVCLRGALGALSLSVEEGRSTFGFRAGIWAKFQGITKGKWSRHQSLGFLKVWLVTCFSWFYYRS